MKSARRRFLGIAVGLASRVSMVAMAHAQGVLGNLANNDSVFIDGRTFSIIAGKSKTQTESEISKLGATELGPGALIFRLGDKLYIADTPRVIAYLSDADVARQQPQ